jgi:hypothetical protein
MKIRWFHNPNSHHIKVLTGQVHGMVEEIALAERKKIGLQAAIDSRKKTLARLQAQLCLEQSAAPSAPSMSDTGH